MIDGTFFVPDAVEAGSREARLLAFVVAPDRTRKQILEGLRSRVDPVFLPRPLVLVDALPRNPTGKLPRELNCTHSQGTTWTGARDSRRIVFAAGFSSHVRRPFPGQPDRSRRLPARRRRTPRQTTGCARKGQGVRVAGVSSVKFTRPLRPEEICEIAFAAPGADALRFRLQVGAAPCAKGAFTLQPAGTHDD